MSEESYACHSPEHEISRRKFLGGVTAGAGVASLGGLDGIVQPTLASELRAKAKRVLLVFQHGGLSQLESWDPKPNTDTGGPFHPIATSVPGVHVSELLPHTSRQMHHLTLLRGLNTHDPNHDSARVTMLTGWRQGFVGGDYPSMGAICTKYLGDGRTKPGYIVLTNRDQWHLNSMVDASFLGSRFAPVVAFDEKPPDNLVAPPSISDARSARRAALRRELNTRFRSRGKSDKSQAYESVFDKALQLMDREKLFRLDEISDRDQDRYGTHAFGVRCLMTRKLLESGCTYVKLNHGNYDTHFENFNHHLHRLGEFDRPFAALLEDIVDRGLYENTLIVVMGEFGRTPKINASSGRDHWSDAWSIAVGGCGVKTPGIFGRTNSNGTEVRDGEINVPDIFHTLYRALGIDPTEEIYDDTRPVKVTDPEGKAIREVLA